MGSYYTLGEEDEERIPEPWMGSNALRFCILDMYGSGTHEFLAAVVNCTEAT